MSAPEHMTELEVHNIPSGKLMDTAGQDPQHAGTSSITDGAFNPAL
jgi:hypothetical protein